MANMNVLLCPFDILCWQIEFAVCDATDCGELDFCLLISFLVWGNITLHSFLSFSSLSQSRLLLFPLPHPD